MTGALDCDTAVFTVHDLIDIAASLSVPNRRRLLRSIVGRLDHPIFLPLLQSLIFNLSEKDVARVATVLGRHTGFVIEDFDEAFAPFARHDADSLRTAIMAFSEMPQSNRFLSSTLTLRPEDVDWLAQHEMLHPHRKARLLDNVIRRSSAEAIRSLAKSQMRLSSIIQLLAVGIPSSANVIARLLLVRPIETEFELIIGIQATRHIDKELQAELSMPLLKFASQQVDCSTGVIIELASLFLESGHSANELIQLCIPPYSSGHAISRNLVALTNGSPKLRTSLIDNVSSLSHCLMRKSVDYGSDAYNAWAAIIQEFTDRDLSELGQLAIDVTTYVLRLTSYSVSPVVVATFPSAIRTLRAESRTKRSIFGSDKAKWLVRDLVYAFMQSAWPPKTSPHARFFRGGKNRPHAAARSVAWRRIHRAHAKRYSTAAFKPARGGNSRTSRGQEGQVAF